MSIVQKLSRRRFLSGYVKIGFSHATFWPLVVGAAIPVLIGPGYYVSNQFNPHDPEKKADILTNGNKSNFAVREIITEEPWLLDSVEHTYSRLFRLAEAFPQEEVSMDESCLENILISGRNVSEGLSELPTTSALYDAKKNKITISHPYSTPEVITNVVWAFEVSPDDLDGTLSNSHTFYNKEGTVYSLDEHFISTESTQFEVDTHLIHVDGTSDTMLVGKGFHEHLCKFPGYTISRLEEQLRIVDTLSEENPVTDLVYDHNYDILYIQAGHNVYWTQGNSAINIAHDTYFTADEKEINWENFSVASYLVDIDYVPGKDIAIEFKGNSKYYVSLIDGKQAHVTYRENSIAYFGRLSNYHWMMPDTLIEHIESEIGEWHE